jgi:hypothetical protein
MGASGSVLNDDIDCETADLSPKDKNRAHQKSGLQDDAPTFVVSLGFWRDKSINLPDSFKLRISYESLDFVRIDDDTPIIQFPFQNIICWGSSQHYFQFKIFDLSEKSGKDGKATGILISLKTLQGRVIEETTMSIVQKLMVDINQRAISKVEFAALIESVFDKERKELKDNWMLTIEQFTAGGRKFLAKQGMELLLKIGKLAPFEKFDLACLLYEKIINKNSFQLLVNTFEDEKEKENLIHRLKLMKSQNKNKTDKFVTNCSLLPENSEKDSIREKNSENKMFDEDGTEKDEA